MTVLQKMRSLLHKALPKSFKSTNIPSGVLVAAKFTSLTLIASLHLEVLQTLGAASCPSIAFSSYRISYRNKNITTFHIKVRAE